MTEEEHRMIGENSQAQASFSQEKLNGTGWEKCKVFLKVTSCLSGTFQGTERLAQMGKKLEAPRTLTEPCCKL